MNTIAFFNNKGGVGKTTLLYHVAYMLAEQGKRVLVADLDPQSNITSMFLPEERLEEIWPAGEHPLTIFGAMRPLIRGKGDVGEAHIEPIEQNLGLIVGDLALSTFEDKLSEVWHKCHNRDESAFRVMTAFYRTILQGAKRTEAEWILLDVGPNLDAINRAALIACDFVVVPLAPDLFSLQGLRNLGPSLKTWRETWAELKTKNPDPEMEMPSGRICPLGYVVLQHGIRDSRPPKAYQRWIDQFPSTFRSEVLHSDVESNLSSKEDSYCLATLKHYRSLAPMAMEVRKPIFRLKPADGAIGAHVAAVLNVKTDFQNLTERIQERIEEERAEGEVRREK